MSNVATAHLTLAELQSIVIKIIERNQKQENLMGKLESALDVINGKEIEDLNGCMYNFRLV